VLSNKHKCAKIYPPEAEQHSMKKADNEVVLIVYLLAIPEYEERCVFCVYININ
jgi:hypothetical protein